MVCVRLCVCLYRQDYLYYILCTLGTGDNIRAVSFCSGYDIQWRHVSTCAHTHIHTHAHIQIHTQHTHTHTHNVHILLSSYSLRIQIFHKILLQYTYVALFRDKIDGSLRGLMLIGIDREIVEGKKCTIVKVWLDHVINGSCDYCSHQQVGLVLFKNAYHGGPLILLLMAYYLMKGLYKY